MRDSCRDRFGILNDDCPYRLVKETDPVPVFDRSCSNLGELCLKRAEELISKSPDGIAVSWSGGVDSTAVISSLLLAGLSPRILHVFFTDESIQEAPRQYEFLKSAGVRLTKKQKGAIDYSSLDEDVLVFGWGADQIYHYFKLYDSKDLAAVEWQVAMKKIYQQLGFLRWLDEDLNRVELYSSSLSWPVKTWFDACVLLNSGLRFSGLRDFFKNQCNDSGIRKKTVMFFDSPSFFNWGYMNKEKVAEYFFSGSTLNYKPELKELIYSLDRDSEYRQRKGKEGSWSKQYPKWTDVNHLEIGVHDTEGFKHYRWNNIPYNRGNYGLLLKLFDSVMQPYLRYSILR